MAQQVTRRKVLNNWRTVSKKNREIIYTRDGHQCLKCGSRECLTIDHIKPLVLGGRNIVENYQTLCENCNGEKGENCIDYRRDKSVTIVCRVPPKLVIEPDIDIEAVIRSIEYERFKKKKKRN